MSQFCRDDENPLPWQVPVLSSNPGIARVEASLVEARDAGTEFPFSSLVVGDDVFYPLALFHMSTSHQPLPFPRSILVSSNYFRPSWAGLDLENFPPISLNFGPSKVRILADMERGPVVVCALVPISVFQTKLKHPQILDLHPKYL